MRLSLGFVEEREPLVFVAEPFERGFRFLDFVTQFALVDLGEQLPLGHHIADAHGDLRQAPRRRRGHLKDGVAVVTILFENDPAPVDLQGCLVKPGERDEPGERGKQHAEQSPMPRRDDPQRRVQLFKRLDGPLLGQKGETRRGALAHGEVTSRKDDGSGERWAR